MWSLMRGTARTTTTPRAPTSSCSPSQRGACRERCACTALYNTPGAPPHLLRAAHLVSAATFSLAKMSPSSEPKECSMAALLRYSRLRSMSTSTHVWSTAAALDAVDVSSYVHSSVSMSHAVKHRPTVLAFCSASEPGSKSMRHPGSPGAHSGNRISVRSTDVISCTIVFRSSIARALAHISSWRLRESGRSMVSAFRSGRKLPLRCSSCSATTLAMTAGGGER
mmetsp:Transcript_163/g.491  ORF Transcript_163/g.491 Transcript_163/m.491 type:complete len:224 (-) Transcript_163:1098-1769(-)